jgi:hypothetical protein
VKKDKIILQCEFHEKNKIKGDHEGSFSYIDDFPTKDLTNALEVNLNIVNAIKENFNINITKTEDDFSCREANMEGKTFQHDVKERHYQT